MSRPLNPPSTNSRWSHAACILPVVQQAVGLANVVANLYQLFCDRARYGEVKLKMKLEIKPLEDACQKKGSAISTLRERIKTLVETNEDLLINGKVQFKDDALVTEASKALDALNEEFLKLTNELKDKKIESKMALKPVREAIDRDIQGLYQGLIRMTLVVGTVYSLSKLFFHRSSTSRSIS